MGSLTEEQVEFIRRRLLRAGISMRELENDILDHLCSSVERELSGSITFDKALDKALEEFLPAGGFTRIQLEVNMLNVKTIFMKKTILISALIFSVFFFVSMLLFSFQLLSGSNGVIIAFFNQLVLCLFILPLYWVHQYQMAKTEPHIGLAAGAKAFMFLAGFFCSEALVNAVFLKIMHMPGVNPLFIIASVFGLIYGPLYCIRKYKLFFTISAN